jgi:hypothetical protein
MVDEHQLINMRDQRSCNGCTKCCDGWLSGKVYDHAFFPGQPCFFKSSAGCSVYSERPQDPCKNFECVWVENNSPLPSWMKPSEINCMIVRETFEGVPQLTVYEAGSKLDSSVLSWIVTYCLNKKINLVYQVGGGWNRINF